MNTFLYELNQAFHSLTLRDIKAFQNLADTTRRDPHTGDLMAGRGLSDKPFFYYAFIAFFACRGSGVYKVDKILSELPDIPDPKEGGQFLNRGRLSEFLEWSSRVGLFIVKWGPANPPISVERKQFEIDVSPLFWKWHFESMEVEHEN